MKSRTKMLLCSAIIGISVTGCMRNYDKPEYADVDTNETAFLVPLEGDGGAQVKFQSVEMLENAKVATKRVQIPHRWSQEGRMSNDGQYIPMARLIKVNRSPVTRVWTASSGTGTSAKNEAVHVESKDSVGFEMGFTCTAYVREEDTAKFLYMNAAGALDKVMDSEFLGRIQTVSQGIMSQYDVDVCRAKKAELQKAVSQDIVEYYKNRGITVSNVGIVGGFTYENPAIQKAIDEAAIAQNLKVVEQAKYEAQLKRNETIQIEATATAEKMTKEAEGQAQSKLITAKAEAEGIKAVNAAVTEAAHNPMFLQFKALEIEKARAERWNGQYPVWYIGGGSSNMPGLMLNVPAPTNPNPTGTDDKK